MNRDKRGRLGRGLGALLGEDYLDDAPAGKVQVKSLPLSRITPNPFQPRREFRKEELEELTKSIRENGLLQPLLVRPDPDGGADRYQLVAGERRLRAVTELGWTEVPATVRELDDRTLLVLALVENLQREALGPIEEAEGYQLLSDDFGLTQGEIAEAVGKSRPAVANALRLLRLPPSLRKLLQDGILSMGHARALLALEEDPGRLLELGRRAAEEGWSVRETESQVRAHGGRTQESGKKKKSRVVREPTLSPAARAYQEALREALGARVRLREGKQGSGSIEVPFASPEDFARVFEIMTGRDPAEIAD